MNENKEFWEAFISIYKSHACLWKVKSKEYMNSDLRNAAYSELIEKAKEIHDNADLAFVKKKIESMRNCFRRELRKVKKSLKTGSSADSVYKPTLWYFDLLLFTSDQEEARHGTSSIASPLSTTEDSADETIIHQTHSPSTSSEVSTPSNQQQQPEKNKSSKNSLTLASKKAKFLDIASSELQRPKYKEQAFGDSVCNDLEKMEEKQCIIAKKLIADILYHGRLGNLNEQCNFTVERVPENITLNTHPSHACNTYYTLPPVQDPNTIQQEYNYLNIDNFQPLAKQTSSTGQRSLRPDIRIVQDVAIDETELQEYLRFKKQ